MSDMYITIPSYFDDWATADAETVGYNGAHITFAEGYPTLAAAKSYSSNSKVKCVIYWNAVAGQYDVVVYGKSPFQIGEKFYLVGLANGREQGTVWTKSGTLPEAQKTSTDPTIWQARISRGYNLNSFNSDIPVYANETEAFNAINDGDWEEAGPEPGPEPEMYERKVLNMNGGYVMIDCTGVNLQTAEKTVNGLFSAISKAFETDKPVVAYGIINEGDAVVELSPANICLYFDDENKLFGFNHPAGFAITVSNEDVVTIQ